MTHAIKRILNCLALAAALGFIGVSIFVTASHGHEAASGMAYDAWCCNGNAHTGDCQQIPAHSVRVIPGGYQVTIEPGDHRLATRRHQFSMPQSEARRSTDGAYHLCLYPDEATPRCFFAPDMSF